MAGHSKWANIKHRKAKQDAAKGKIYTRLIREVTVAARMGDPDPASNSRLRLAVDKAFASNMSKEVVDRAIKRGAGGIDGADVEEIRYEGYGPGGVAILVDCMTNNRNRTVAEVRHAFSKGGGNLGTDGSVAWLFAKKGEISIEPGCDVDDVMDVALDVGADDVIVNDDKSIDVITSPEAFQKCLAAVMAAKFVVVDSGVNWSASTGAKIGDKETAEKFLNLIDRLEDLDDVQDVFSNAELPDL